MRNILSTSFSNQCILLKIFASFGVKFYLKLFPNAWLTFGTRDGLALSRWHAIIWNNEDARPLLWRHNGRDSVSNHQLHDCLLNRLFRRRSKKTSKLRVTGLCDGNSPGTGEFPAQMASNAENVSIWWRHHVNDAYELDVCLPPMSAVLPLGSSWHCVWHSRWV